MVHPHNQMSCRHIGLFVRSFRGGGGAERVMLNLAAGLADRGHRIDLVMGRKVGHFLDEIPENVNIVDLDTRPAHYSYAKARKIGHIVGLLGIGVFVPKAAWILQAVPALAEYLTSQRPTALLSALSYPNIVALLARRLSTVPTRVIVSQHNHLSTALAHAGKLHRIKIAALARRLFPEAEGVVAVSNGVADNLAKVLGLPRARIATIYNPVCRPEISIQARASPNHAWFAPDDPPVILGAGKLKAQKDFDCLLRAFARIRAIRPVRLVILGEGPRRKALLSLARELGVAEDVALPGFVANPFAYLGRAAVFVLSSAWEGLPTVLIEALACGCPVVSTDCPSGPAEILDGGRYGPLVPVGNDAALARAICDALDAPPRPELLHDRARFFSTDRAVEQYCRVLLER